MSTKATMYLSLTTMRQPMDGMGRLANAVGQDQES